MEIPIIKITQNDKHIQPFTWYTLAILNQQGYATHLEHALITNN